MTKEDIKELARKYATMTIKDPGKVPEKIEEAIPVLTWLFSGHITPENLEIPEDIYEMAEKYSEYLSSEDEVSKTMIYLDSLGFLGWVLEKYDLIKK